MTHFLVIESDLDEPSDEPRDWEIVHDIACPRVDLYGGGVVFDYACDLGREVSNVGLPEQLTTLPPGRYEIRYWERSQAVDMWGTVEVTHSGIGLVIHDEASLVLASGIDPEWWKQIMLKGRKTGFSWEGDHERP